MELEFGNGFYETAKYYKSFFTIIAGILEIYGLIVEVIFSKKLSDESTYMLILIFIEVIVLNRVFVSLILVQ